MVVRPLRPTDVVGLASFLRRGDTMELTAHTWPGVEPGSARVPLASLATRLLAAQPGSRRAWVADSEGGLAGLAVTRPRAGGLAWDVEHLHTLQEHSGRVASELLESVGACAGGRGTRRVFLEMPAQAEAQDAARRAGYERYSANRVYVLAPGFSAERTDQLEARPRLRADAHSLFQLYCAAVPAPVRAAEAMMFDEWEGLWRGPRRWTPSLGGSRQQYVWELGASLVGWLQLRFGQRSQLLELLVHPRFEDASDRLVRYALAHVSPKAPVYAVAREYQPSLASALERAGFTLVAEHELYVQLLAVRVREPALAPATLVGA